MGNSLSTLYFPFQRKLLAFIYKLGKVDKHEVLNWGVEETGGKEQALARVVQDCYAQGHFPVQSQAI